MGDNSFSIQHPEFSIQKRNLTPFFFIFHLKRDLTPFFIDPIYHFSLGFCRLESAGNEQMAVHVTSVLTGPKRLGFWTLHRIHRVFRQR
ncbi:MAG: hypothetical protein N838_24750 [Thiohalocapsa sp. PB-PSB1]|nr:MAG: hypothetical protein N838_20040 [Thiohalocapsa sp. PB-PSB1]QQO56084.1 MAG: hypothetical protein N838_24750 [Thiohalocapsa sp. PB-PSB1]